MPQPLASKERTLFQQVVKNYESKQYKKGLKAAEQILKKNPNHGDTKAMKALILNSQGSSEEAFALAKVALTHDMKSHVCWHVYGLLYRSDKNYEESIKAYKFALKLEPESQQIQRDLALLQVQMRDYPGYVQSRRAMLQSRPTLRQNWTALAIAQHLDGDLEAAERTLTTYEESLKNPPPKSDLEHQECQLYKNNLIAEMDQTQRALEHLNAIAKGNYDQQSILEARAEYLLKLNRKEEAAKAYRRLLDRNLDKRAYYTGLQKALGIEDSDTEKRNNMYQEYAEKSSRADAPRRAPLDFLHGDDFRHAVEIYLQRMLSKGVPSTFANLKTLYADATKQQAVQEVVEDFAAGKKGLTNGSGDDASKEESEAKNFELFTLYFLAQHYDYYKSRDLSRALKLVDEAIAKKPDSVDFHMTRARIFKHMGDLAQAAAIMEHARTLDERDRYINTKAAKYQLRNDDNAAAITSIGKFTRQDAVGGPLGDLIDMQCMWFLWEDGASYLRQNKLGLALKRFTSIYKIFDVWQEDQFDFHSFSMRRGQVRAYVDLLKFEDQLREHPFWTRTAISAVRAYILLSDFPHLAKGSGAAHAPNESKEDPNAAKKAAKKARKEKEKQEQAEAERRDAKKTAGGKAATEEDKKKEDKDPEGKEILATQTPLDDALKFLIPMLELSPKSLEGQKAGYELYLRRGKWIPALRCLLAVVKLGAPIPTVHSMGMRLVHASLSSSSSSSPSPKLPPLIQSNLQKHLSQIFPSSLSPLIVSNTLTSEHLLEANKAFLGNASTDPHVIAACYEVQSFVDPSSWTDSGKTEAARALAAAIKSNKDVSLFDARSAMGWCRDHGVDPASVQRAGEERFPEAASSLRVGVAQVNGEA